MSFIRFLTTLCLCTTPILCIASETPLPIRDDIVFREGVVLAPSGRAGRAPVHEDAVEAMIVSGKWTTPKAGDTVTLPNGGTRSWEAVTADENGAFMNRTLAGGYLCCTVTSDADAIMLLETAGSNMVYVNGQPRMGDPYQHGYVRLPVHLRAGTNEFLFQGGRGSVRAKLIPARGPFLIDLGDVTAPDLIVSENVDREAAAVVVNATTEPVHDLEITARLNGGNPQRTPVGSLLPLSVRKVGLRLIGAAPEAASDCEVELGLSRAGDQKQSLDAARLKLRVLNADATQKRTFRSAIDGSVQYFAVVPPKQRSPRDSNCGLHGSNDSGAAPAEYERPALILTLHGAGVEALGQAACYSPKFGVVTVAPTNRRPFGFDWEDWGRLDAIEVLERAQADFATDLNRTYLTGHSMGGHGVWHVGVTFPDRFAAIGPSAGWVSMFSYAGARRTNPADANDPAGQVAELLNRCMNPSDTLALKRNYLQQGVYVLHGEKDDNVPVAQARTMKQQLEAMHSDFMYYEEPGVGHWWGKDLKEYSDDNTPWGTACVDWPPMFQFFVKHSSPAHDRLSRVEFVTASPGISARCRWVTIEAQTVQLRPSSIAIEFDPAEQKFVATTENVARLALNLNEIAPEQPLRFEFDGQKLVELRRPPNGTVLLNHERDRWSEAHSGRELTKSPARYGSFKDAFRNNVLLVYGSRGNTIESDWAMARARFDAEQFWYRGNGSLEIVSDSEFIAGIRAPTPKYADRNIVLYGNADNNAAWPVLLADSPVQVLSDRVNVGDRSISGSGLACLLIRPRTDSAVASVAAVSGTGLSGLRLTERLPYFSSGVAYPDLVVIGTESLDSGMNGIRAAGFFGLDWSVASGEFVWNGAE